MEESGLISQASAAVLPVLPAHSLSVSSASLPAVQSLHCRLKLRCTVISLHLCQEGSLLSFITFAINKALSSTHSI